MKVILAEKPSVAREIASVLGIQNKSNGYFENQRFTVTWAFGHLVQLCGPEAYGYKTWAKENLPILPIQFKLQPKQTKSEKGYIDDPGVLHQLNVIRGLFERSEGIIVATDAGREGELIFRLIYAFLGCTKPFQRLWISSLTEKVISEGLKSLKRGEEFDSLFQSAKCRAESDWLVGINATQALTLSAGNKSLISLGRVQTPTLALICQRYLENTNFKSTTYFLVRLQLTKNEQSFYALAIKDNKPHHFANSEEAEKVVRHVANQIAVVEDIQEETIKEPSPLLYDLSTLQQDANKRFGLTADQTLSTAQDLYERKLITYPRTGSRYIGDDVFESIPALIESVRFSPPFAKQADSLIGKPLSTRSVNAEKVTDHHALLPTESKAGELSGHHKIVYTLIVGRMLEAFSDYCSKLVTNAFFKVEGCNYKFATKGVLITQEGWRSVLNIQEDDKEQQLPTLEVLETLPIQKVEPVCQKTKPKALYTEGTLLKAMETCGREIEDDQIRAAMKDCGLGTPATRAATIETLFSRLYIERQKKSLIPTTKGLAVYELVKDQKISQPLLTGEWEQKLEEIRSGESTVSDFKKSISLYTEELTRDLLGTSNGSNTGSFTNGATLFVCPKCKRGNIIIRDKAAGCSEYKTGCDFTIWRTLAGKKLSEANITQLLEKGKTGILKGFEKKSGGTFDAGIMIDENLKTAFFFKR